LETSTAQGLYRTDFVRYRSYDAGMMNPEIAYLTARDRQRELIQRAEHHRTARQAAAIAEHRRLHALLESDAPTSTVIELTGRRSAQRIPAGVGDTTRPAA
jgi:hypothetical protein